MRLEFLSEHSLFSCSVSTLGFKSLPIFIYPFKPTEQYLKEDTNIVLVLKSINNTLYVLMAGLSVPYVFSKCNWYNLLYSLELQKMVMAIFKGQMKNKLVGHPVSLKYLPNNHPCSCTNFQDSQSLT